MRTQVLFFAMGFGMLTEGFSQAVPPPPSGARTQAGNAGAGGVVVIPQAPDPVLVDGKKAQDLSEDQMREFLESKIQTIYQGEGAVELLRVAPGYALTMTFSEPIGSVVVGDPGLVRFTSKGKILVLSANTRSGDTSMQVVLPGDRILNYHIFIAPNFAEAQSTLNVIVSGRSGGGSGGAGGSPYYSRGEGLDIRAIANVISNYDALEQEGAISRSGVKRYGIFRKSDITSFDYYYLYAFKNGPVAISFAYRNPYNYEVRYDESRLRIQMGNMLFIPDYVSFNQTHLGPGETSTGFAVVADPGFSISQPFELNWN
jgi:hypothetical protein